MCCFGCNTPLYRIQRKLIFFTSYVDFVHKVLARSRVTSTSARNHWSCGCDLQTVFKCVTTNQAKTVLATFITYLWCCSWQHQDVRLRSDVMSFVQVEDFRSLLLQPGNKPVEKEAMIEIKKLLLRTDPFKLARHMTYVDGQVMTYCRSFCIWRWRTCMQETCSLSSDVAEQVKQRKTREQCFALWRHWHFCAFS